MNDVVARIQTAIIFDLESCRGRVEPLDQSQALNRFLAGVERRAFRMAEIATGDPDEALDLVQDAMLKLAERYSTRSEDEWPPLFYRILQSRILDWHRRNMVRNKWRKWLGRCEQQEEDDPLQRIPDPRAADPAQDIATRRAVIALDQALRRLPLRQQQAFLLRAWEELDVAETARIMGCSQGSVKTHFSRAVHSLRRQLGVHWL